MALRNSNYNKVITRNYTNDANVQLSSVPESGFDMSYGSRAAGLILGRIYPFTHQKVMPHDTFSSVFSGSVQFNDMATAIAPDMSVHAFTTYVSDRAINCDFDELMSPRVLNNYSASAALPMFSPSAVLAKFLEKFCPSLTVAKWQAIVKTYISQSTTDATAALTTLGITTDTTLNNFNGLFTPNTGNLATLINTLKWSYCDDATYDLMTDAHNILLPWKTYAAVTAAPVEYVSDIFRALYKIFGGFFGKNSVMDMFGYPIVNPYALRRFVNPTSVSSANTFAKLAKLLLYTDSASKHPDSCNEHLLRKWFAFYVEFLRNTQLEPNIAGFNYRKFGSSSLMAVIDGTVLNSCTGMAFIAPRCIPFEEDLYTSLLTDNPCMHAYAPIISPTFNAKDEDGNSVPAWGLDVDALGGVVSNTRSLVPGSTARTKTDQTRETMQAIKIDYYDSINNTEKQIQTYMPSNLGRFMHDVDSSTQTAYSQLRLDFGILRESKQLEKFLKIKYYFSDEYKDELSSIYMVDLADANLFRPKLLGGGSNMIGVQQTVSNAPNADGQLNERGTFGNSNFPNVEAHDFVEEYGDVFTLGWVSVKPSYDPSFRPNYWKRYQDFPNPIFAPNNESLVYQFDLSRCGDETAFAHAPYHFEMRARVDEMHGDFLDEKINCNMPRVWSSLNNYKPVFNYAWLHQSGLPVGFMTDSMLTNGQYYVLAHDNFVVQRLLPQPVETL